MRTAAPLPIRWMIVSLLILATALAFGCRTIRSHRIIRSQEQAADKCRGNDHDPRHTIVCVNEDLKADPDEVVTTSTSEVHWYGMKPGQKAFQIRPDPRYFDSHPCDNDSKGKPHCHAEPKAGAPHKVKLQYWIDSAGAKADPVIIIDDTLMEP
jgi:hypothetical protein